jgi:alpha-beta hydrolase superfamily lysophospholipase
MKAFRILFFIILFSCSTLTTSRKIASVKTTPFSVKSKNYLLSGQIDDVVGSKAIAIFFHGSGVQDRWSTMPADVTLTEKPEPFFKPISEALNDRGISTCVFDKRAFAEKDKTEFEAVLKTFTFDNIKADAEAVVNYIDKLAKYDEIILIGHSEGSVTASEIAFDLKDNKKIVELVLIGVLAENLKTALYRQYTNVMADNTFQSADKNHDGKIFPQEIPEELKPGLPIDKIDRDKKGYITYDDLIYVLKLQVDGLFKAIQEAPADFIISNKPVQWYRDLIGRKTLINQADKYSVPMLIAHGALDQNVTFQSNAEALASRLIKLKKNVTLKSFPKYGHALSPQKNGLPSLGPIQSDAVNEIVNWVISNLNRTF